MLQGAVGHVRLVNRGSQQLVEKRMTDRRRHDTEVGALRALVGSGLPVPQLVEVSPGSILMTYLPGERLDRLDAERQLAGLRTSSGLLRQLHQMPLPGGMPDAPDDESIIRRYRDAGGPPLPLRIPPAHHPVFCHGDWTNGNLLVTGTEITGVVDWEAAHIGDPLRELSRAAWGASLNDPRFLDALVDGYGADRADVMAWVPIHAAELWLWFAEAGPPEYLASLTQRLTRWPA
jgi:aminoglycoside phosphotransferase